MESKILKRAVYAVFVAGGSGTRMGGDVPKQFIELNGVPILQRSIERFLDAAPEAKVITVLPPSHEDLWRSLCFSAAFSQTIVHGGLTRFHSVQNALSKVPDGAVAVIHDGVRPLFSTGLVERMLEQMQDCPALIPVLPVTDTLRSTDPSLPDPDRSRLVAVQTPQMFWSEKLKEAYRQPYDTAFTDDASVVSRTGVPVRTVAGERFNLKITTPEDLILARAILASGC